MINFLNYHLKPSVTSSAVADDFYHPDNLISKDINRGFMAYHVIKPPVDLIFNFICSVDLHYIKIWSNLGSMRTTGIEISFKCDDIFLRGGQFFCKDDNSELGTIFYRSEFYKSVELDRIINSDKFVKIPLQNWRKLKSGTKEIKVTIKSTARCACVLQKIEVWGQPAKSCTIETKNEIYRLWNLAINVQTTQQIDDRSASDDVYKLDLIENDLIEQFQIPEEFMDSITYAIMTLPMVLPSGKIVDQSTIDKHNILEETFGRQPSDPFTGQIYTNCRKPIFDSVLKSKIDQFVIKNQNANEIINIPRTIGKSMKVQKQIPQNHYIENLNKRLKIVETEKINNSIETDNNILSISSLDIAVKNALKNITRFSQVKNNVENLDSKIISEICFNCKLNKKMYSINICNHLICRNCLLNGEIKKCSCGLEFESKDVNKLHL